MGRVVHFEITGDNPEKLGKFYADVFGWELQKWEGPFEYWLVSTGAAEQAGIDGAIMERGENLPQTVNTIDVESAETAVEAVKANGGKALREIQPIPGVGFFTYCADPDGNVFGVMQADENAG